MVASKVLVCISFGVLVLPWCCHSLITRLNIIGAESTGSPLSGINPQFEEVDKQNFFADESLGCEIDDEGGSGDAKEGRLRKVQEHPRIYLFSLNWIQESDPGYFKKKDVRRLWEWKDTILGDGRDFFVPKPRTLMGLQTYLLQNIQNLQECSVISNCARLEILCSFYSPSEFDKDEEKRQKISAHLARELSNCLVTQLNYYQDLSKTANPWAKMMMQLPMNSDRPDCLLTSNPPSEVHLPNRACYESWWNVTTGNDEILTHLCKVSAGMGHRPRRPDRPIVFRPFSSRDAHILLQLKRTRENIGFSSVYGDGKNRDAKRQRKLLPIVMDYALRAGKAARNPDIVPEIEELRDFTSAESSHCTPSDLRVSQRVADAAFEKGIVPLINECAIKLYHSSQRIDQRISEFRQCAYDLLSEVESDETDEVLHPKLRMWLNRRLHEPTIHLRSKLEPTGASNGNRHKKGEIDIGCDSTDSFLRESLARIREELDNEYQRLKTERAE